MKYNIFWRRQEDMAPTHSHSRVQENMYSRDLFGLPFSFWGTLSGNPIMFLYISSVSPSPCFLSAKSQQVRVVPPFPRRTCVVYSHLVPIPGTTPRKYQ